MPLAVGTKAPDFTLPTKTADGPKQITLSENFGKRNTLLAFFPMAFTSTCTTEMCGVSSDLSAYAEMNAAVYGISGDNPFAQEAWAQKEKIKVPLLSDYEHQVASIYDAVYDSFLPQIGSRDGRCAEARSFRDRSRRRDPIRRLQRRRARSARFRQGESEIGGAEMTTGTLSSRARVEGSRGGNFKLTQMGFLDSVSLRSE